MLKKRRFARMYQQYADDIYRFFLVHVRDRQLAEDMTADTFLNAWKRFDAFDFKHPRGWLYAIARNSLTDHWRRKKPIPLNEEIEIVDESESHGVILDKEIDARRLAKAVAGLPTEMKSVVTLRFLEGYSAKQAAEALGLSESNIRVIQFRALKILRKKLL